MEQVLNAAQIVLSIFTMIGLGMFLVKINWIKDEHGTLISTLVTKVALPCMIISNIFNKFTRESLVESVVGIIIPFLSIIVTFLIGMLIAKLIRLPKRRRACSSACSRFQTPFSSACRCPRRCSGTR